MDYLENRRIAKTKSPVVSSAKVVSDLEIVTIAIERLLKKLERYKTEIITLTNKKTEQAEQIKMQRKELQVLERKLKESEKKRKSLTETLINHKEFPIIAKNLKNTDVESDLKKKLNNYIRYIEETITLLKTV
jgi:hypothetical protein